MPSRVVLVSHSRSPAGPDLVQRHTQQEGHAKSSGTCRQPSEKAFCIIGGSQLEAAPGSRTPAALGGAWGYRWPLVQPVCR
jgi:hypothetical protein